MRNIFAIIDIYIVFHVQINSNIIIVLRKNRLNLLALVQHLVIYFSFKSMKFTSIYRFCRVINISCAKIDHFHTTIRACNHNRISLHTPFGSINPLYVSYNYRRNKLLHGSPAWVSFIIFTFLFSFLSYTLIFESNLQLN